MAAMGVFGFLQKLGCGLMLLGLLVFVITVALCGLMAMNPNY
jgi:hypothetical protein